MKKLTWKVIVNKFEASRAPRAAQKVILEEIYLTEANIWRKQGIIPSEVLALKHKCSTEVIFPKQYNRRLDIYSILCKFGVAGYKDKSPNKPIIKIEASFYTSFSYDLKDPDFKGLKDTEEDDVVVGQDPHSLYQYLYEATPISTAWPYWREFVQSTSARTEYPSLMVPLLDIVQEEYEIDFSDFK